MFYTTDPFTNLELQTTLLNYPNLADLLISRLCSWARAGRVAKAWSKQQTYYLILRFASLDIPQLTKWMRVFFSTVRKKWWTMTRGILSMFPLLFSIQQIYILLYGRLYEISYFFLPSRQYFTTSTLMKFRFQANQWINQLLLSGFSFSPACTDLCRLLSRTQKKAKLLILSSEKAFLLFLSLCNYGGSFMLYREKYRWVVIQKLSWILLYFRPLTFFLSLRTCTNYTFLAVVIRQFSNARQLGIVIGFGENYTPGANMDGVRIPTKRRLDNWILLKPGASIAYSIMCSDSGHI